jgi:hypothetical protein
MVTSPSCFRNLTEARDGELQMKTRLATVTQSNQLNLKPSENKMECQIIDNLII